MTTSLGPSMPGKVESTKKEVDSCWHVAALGFLEAFLVSVIISNSGFFYVGLMEEFDVNRESATWPRSVTSSLFLLSGCLMAPLQRKMSLFAIFFLGGLFAWTGVVASAFVPNMTWMTITLGAIYGVGLGITTMTYSILLALYFDKYRGLTSGMKYAGASCAGLVFPKLLAYLQDKYSFRGTLLICGGIVMHVSAIGIFATEPPWTCL
ncbi:LOW QUALITY PROTEIN: monocarboxylate transporter 6-like [Ixodes scapularis]|uniref:LOW QUALITY PROTEIN: monocarboxylate transporter 6-like n=1 Tax=Ixodes scapularis TaxID=6945 RepID=UPI001A9E5EC9|nr:LOW QUALITY PROTEIN: monocarboxylate transporter 6-like [Ixodes scapularis]